MKKLRAIFPTVLVLASGVVLYSLLFRGTKNPQRAIKRTFKANGLSPSQARIWEAVSRLETANYSSNLFRAQNNLWGMKQPLTRATTSTGAGPTGFATYRNLDESADDLILYMEEFNYPKNETSLFATIATMKKNGYFEISLTDYYERVLPIFKKLLP